MQLSNSPEIHPGDGTYGESHDGQREGSDGMGAIENGSINKTDQNGNEEVNQMFATANWQNAERMWEQKTERLWEQLNAPDANQGKYCESISDMEVASKHLDKATDFLAQAADDVTGLPLENKIIALLNALEDLACDIRNLRGRVQDGREN